MARKNFWEEKWLNDQYNQRNPGQATIRKADLDRKRDPRRPALRARPLAAKRRSSGSP
jgi:hypothetical protein